VATRDWLSLRQAAEALELEPQRLYRLGRYLRLAPGDPCLPPAVVARARAETGDEERYSAILDWLLGRLRGDGPRGADGPQPLS
jgi:hypothetical protein